MAYQALYRSYRPMSFKEVVGQEHVTHTLKNAIIEHKISHAYVFSGLRGIGKTTVARILAKAVNCENPIDGEPCNKCPSCKAINENTTTDIIELDAASNNGVDEIRSILEKVNYQPSMLKKKVYIIDEVHMLTTSAFNALLKTLEEPPSFDMFILATTEPYKIPLTILSRCQRFDFKQLTINELSQQLAHIAEEEHIQITDEALASIAESAEGGMRDAISILDQTATYADGNITIDAVNNITGNVTGEKLIGIIDALKDNDSSTAMAFVDEIINSGKEVNRITLGLIELCKDLLLAKELSTIPNNKSIYSNPEFLELAKNIDLHKLFYYIDSFNEVLNKSKYSNTPKIYLEVGLIKMVSNVSSDLDVSEKINELESRLSESGYSNGIDYSMQIRLLENKISSLSNLVENPQNNLDLVKIKLTNLEQEIGKLSALENISTKLTNLEEEINTLKSQSNDNSNGLVPDTVDESSINEINTKVEELREAVVNINNTISSIKASLNSKETPQEEKSLFTVYEDDDAQASNVSSADLSIIKSQLSSLESRIVNLESNGKEETNLSSVYEEIENIKVDISNIYERIEKVSSSEITTNPQEEPNQVTDASDEAANECQEGESSLEEQTETLEESQEVDDKQEEITTDDSQNDQEDQLESSEESKNKPQEEISDETSQEQPEIVEPTEEEKDFIDLTSEIYDVHILEEILNDALTPTCRAEKVTVCDKWPTLLDKAGGKLQPIASIMSSGVIQANGVTKLLLVYPNPETCNYLMDPEHHDLAKQVLFYTYNREYDFLALPTSEWDNKRQDFRSQYAVGILQPRLSPISNPYLKIIKHKEEETISKHDEMVKNMSDFFDDDMKEE